MKTRVHAVSLPRETFNKTLEFRALLLSASPRFLHKVSSSQQSASANRDASYARHGAPLEGPEDDLQTPAQSGHTGGAVPQLHHAGDTDRHPSRISGESDFAPPLGTNVSLPAESSVSENEEHVGGARIVAQRWGQYGREYRLLTRNLEEAPTIKWVREADLGPDSHRLLSAFSTRQRSLRRSRQRGVPSSLGDHAQN
ncbi:hypothetical protein Ae201684P_019554 [Aphanomyces euteiches]|nr:hypothetical protein Ae201684P_019554 [Aphanomyces euteiches]